MSEWEINTSWSVDDNEFVARADKRSDTSGMEEMIIKKYSDYHKKTFDIIRECKFEIPKSNETITILTTKSFSSIGVVDFIISQKGNPTETIFYILLS